MGTGAPVPESAGADRYPEYVQGDSDVPRGSRVERARDAVSRLCGDHPLRGLRPGRRPHPPPAHPLRRPRRDGLPGHDPGDGAVVHGHRPRVGDRVAGPARRRRADRGGRPEALRARAGRAERVVAPARPADPRAVQLLPGRSRRGLRLPVGDVPAHGVPARREVLLHARPAPGRAARVRGAGEGAGGAEPVRRGAAAARPPRPRRPRGRAEAGRGAEVRAVPRGRGRVDRAVRR